MDAVGPKMAGQTTVVARTFGVVDRNGGTVSCLAIGLAGLGGGVVVHSAVRAPGVPSCAIHIPSSPSSATTGTTPLIATAAAVRSIRPSAAVAIFVTLTSSLTRVFSSFLLIVRITSSGEGSGYCI